MSSFPEPHTEVIFRECIDNASEKELRQVTQGGGQSDTSTLSHVSSKNTSCALHTTGLLSTQPLLLLKPRSWWLAVLVDKC